ncbi:ATP-dependent bile acid transporter [Cryptococcus neoformans]|nr:ATP-dependent bile acid transporter [Cryptococcus neoformans var. grubii]OXC59312.1 ATP-dependent bile acid transporter [Cryptococcus neoformans var. grubii MW-RSA852]
MSMPSYNASMYASETETLLPHSPPSPRFFSSSGQYTDNDHDHPVQIDSFLHNVKICKSALGASLLGTFVMEIWHLSMSVAEVGHWRHSGTQHKAIEATMWADILGTTIICFLSVLYIASLLKPITVPYVSLSPQIQNSSLHRSLCTTTFTFILFLFISHSSPGVTYTVWTHLSSPRLSDPMAEGVYHLRTMGLILALSSVGFMRRGPKMYFPPPRLGTGFGLNTEPEEESTKKNESDIGGYGEDGDQNHDEDRRKGVVIKLAPAQEIDDPLASAVSAITIERQRLPPKVPEEPKYNVFDYNNSSMINFVLLTYIAPLAIRSAHVASLHQSDLPILEDETRNSGVYETAFASNSASQTKLIGLKRMVGSKTTTSWQLVKTLWVGMGWTVFISFVLETTRNLISFIQIAALHEIIQSFKQSPGEDKSYAYLMCWAMFFGQTVEVLLSAYCCVRENYMLHIPVRMNISSIILAKILRTTDAKALEAHNTIDSNSDNGKERKGTKEKKTSEARGRSQVMNLLTIDTNTVASLATHTWSFTNGITTLIIGASMLYGMLGVSAFVGIACVPLSTPLTWLVAKLIYRCDIEWARARDARTGALKEFLLGIKVIKLNAFEPYFMHRISKLRAHEVKWQRWRFTLGTAFNVLADQLPILSILITFAFHTKIMGRPLDAPTAFVALNIFNRVKDGLQTFPQIIQTFLSCKVSLDRLSRYLSQPEIDDDRSESVSRRIICRDATITWPVGEGIDKGDTVRFKLEGLDLKVPEGRLSLLCGPLGSGKTLLLRAFLGEAKVEKGSVLAPKSLPDATPILLDNEIEATIHWTAEHWLDDSIAYAPQQSFIRHGTLRDNILFGQPMWRERYQEALRQAALLPDLEILEDGDMTEVGENGVTFSGGQKARVNLARCIYSRALTIYLDDILSAVDAHTAQFIYQECLQGSLLKNRTVVLVTHHVRLVLPAASYVISLNAEGRIDQACSPSQIDLNTLSEFAPNSPINSEDIKPAAQLEMKQPINVGAFDAKTTRKLYQEEQRAVGRVSDSHYFLIFRAAGGIWYWLILAILYGGHRALTMLRIFWLEHWSANPSPEHLNYNLIVYTAIVSFGILIGAFRWIWLYGISNVGFYSRGNRRVHDLIMARLFSAPLQFFEKTPQGRLLNVFGQDMWRLDCNVADDFGRTIMAALAIITSAAVVFFKEPLVTIIAVAFGIPLFWFSGHLNKLRSDIRRLTATASSPLYSLYNEAIDGIVMIRAFGQDKLMMATMKVLNNRERATYLADWTVYNWVSAFIRILTNVVITATSFALIERNISPSQAGLILNFALTVSGGLFGLMEQYSHLEQTFVSAERISQYTTMSEHESEEGVCPPPEWPQQGRIDVRKLSVRYAPDLPQVLKNVSFTVEPGMHVGLVGATGSGKSTLALSLFRAIEYMQGEIMIDGVNISGLILSELRGRLNMVAQDGMLCSGTLREALDVTGGRSDQEIFDALRKVHLISNEMSQEELIENPFANLETYVAIEGTNFSQGQRQLLCLARALLKQSKILVMDEATSSVDFETDSKITAMIKECFMGTTMLVIAHRLATIMQYDMVLVLDQGQIIESGKPRELIHNNQSVFYGLCMAQGKGEYAILCKIAAITG